MFIQTPYLLHRLVEQVPTFTEMLDQLRSKRANAFAVIYSYFLARVASRLTVLPGEEFRIAYEEALVSGAVIKLGDRPIQVSGSTLHFNASHSALRMIIFDSWVLCEA
jgi:pheromone shutdown protein TraB